jgi:mono/diheme cytochrome c family protein
MAANSTGFALSAGMAAIVVLLGYTLLNAVSLVGFAAAEAGPGACGVQAEPESGIVSPPQMQPLLNLTPAEAAVVAAGDALFKGNCAQCHAVNDKVVGPALAGISARRPMSWLIPWVQNSSKVVASGDAYAVKLFNEYQKQQMPSFSLSDKEIAAIVAYITAQEGTVAGGAGIVVAN